MFYQLLLVVPSSLNQSCCLCYKGKEAGAGAVDEEDFIKAFEDVPAAQVGLEPRSLDLGRWLALRVSGVCWVLSWRTWRGPSRH